MSKITIDIELKPFQVPNFVIPVVPEGAKQDGFQPTAGIPLKDIPLLTLKDMCHEYTCAVLRKANYLTESVL